MKNDLYELTRKRRSVRRYGDKHIDDEIIRRSELCLAYLMDILS